MSLNQIGADIFFQAARSVGGRAVTAESETPGKTWSDRYYLRRAAGSQNSFISNPHLPTGIYWQRRLVRGKPSEDLPAWLREGPLAGPRHLGSRDADGKLGQ